MAVSRHSRAVWNIFYVSVILLHLGATTSTFVLADEYLLFGSGNSIQRVGLDGSAHRTVVEMSGSGFSIFALDYDFSNNYVFWSDVKMKAIMRARLDGTEVTTLVNGTTLGLPEGVAWDWANKKLYWTDSDHKCIDVLDPATGHRMTLIRTGARSQPRAIVVDPSTGYLYWTDWQNDNPRIERATMAGQARTILHNTSLQVPNGLTLDYTNQLLYWTDAPFAGDRIEASHMDGTNRRLVSTLQPDGSHPLSITYHDNHVYWTDWVRKAIQSRSVGERGNITDVLLLSRRPNGVQVITALRQQAVDNPCDGSRCSFLCLLSATEEEGYRCVCPPGLVPNRGACVDPNTLSTATPSSTLQPTATSATTSATTTEVIDITQTPVSKGVCESLSPCKNDGTCIDSINGYFCVCANEFEGRNCDQVSTTTDSSASTEVISSTIFVAVIGGLVLVIVLIIFVLILGLCIMLAICIIRHQRRKRKKLFRNGVSPQPLMRVQRQSADTTSSIAEHEYVSIHSTSPCPTKSLQVPNLPARNSRHGSFGNNYKFPTSLTSSGNEHLQDPEVADNPAYDTRSKILTI